MEKNRLRSVLKGAAIIVAVGALVVIDQRGVICGGGPRLGEPVPDFALPTASGETLRLSALRGQVVLLDFWASWCGVCLRQMPQMEQLHAELGPRGLRLLAINVEGSREVVQRFLASRPLSATVLVDDGRLAAQYAVHALPHLALIDRTGRLIFVQRGGGGQAALRRRVLDALGGGPPGLETTRPH